MAIKRYFATKDNTITNAYKDNLTTRGTGSNMGASDILEPFVIFGQVTSSANVGTAEQSRVIIQFDMNEILADVTNGVVPSSSVDYVLRLYNAPHAGTTPLSYSLDVGMLAADWNEGRGLDMENYSDFGYSNWIQPKSTTTWNVTGGDYYGDSDKISSYFFSGGVEDLELNVNYAIDLWRSLDKSNYGFIIKHTDDIISGNLGTFYTKKFFSRTSEFTLKRPVIEARWNSSRADERGTFLISSSLASATNNINTLYLYNSVRGQLQNIPYLNGERLTVSLYADDNGSPSGSNLIIKDSSNTSVTAITGGILIENGIQRTGIYTASLVTTSSLETLHDVWFTSSDGGVTETQFYTGSISPGTLVGNSLMYNEEYNTSIVNLKDEYFVGEKPTLRVFSRKKNWQPNIYTVATAEVVPDIVESAYYRLFRVEDNFEILPYATGSAATAATATITISDSGGIANAETFTLTDAEGTTTVYIINGGILPANGGGSGGSAVVGFSGVGGGVAGNIAAADAIVKAVNGTTDANYTAVSNGVNKVTITQSTVGTDGNRSTASTLGSTAVSDFTGGTNEVFAYTKMSYDASGSYFSLDTSYLAPGYAYGLQFLYYINGIYEEQKEIFKFRMTEEQQ